MHERTQRRVCRAVYVLACIVPTVFSVVGVLYFHRPWQEQDWQRVLENNLHIRSSISKVTAPSPGERQLFAVRLADLQSDSTLATVDKLHLLSDHSIFADQIELSCNKMDDLTRTLQGWLSDAELPSVTIKVDKLLFARSASQVFELANVVIVIKDMKALDRKLIVQADVVTAEAERGHLRFQVERAENGSWDLSLDCREGQLPAWFFADLIPGASRWNAANFTGALQLHTAQDSTEGTLQGTFSPIDLQEWLGNDSPHTLRSTASLQFETLHLQKHRISDAKGSLESEAGQISSSLTTALRKSLFCVAGKKLSIAHAADGLSFEKLACKFQMSSAGLTVTGNCSVPSSETSGCLILSDGEPILLQPTYSNLPLPYFVQVFCPLDKYWLPGMRKATELAEALPMPESENLKK
ncbi:hypothetical protein [Bythopirellula polymerisocia]|uniref:AsmA-like C-terminal domain-containing protein n=1 Tax=Bythopirellula polymerisocia TaxID=2528003 RepID=A0A5C6CJG4_9BACT|nr:hypothetical protein [Bythopirellula polymerisocia]TWU24588.1 hypothetical protein Pla144_34730 [Bythopirellula polymerisocia]